MILVLILSQDQGRGMSERDRIRVRTLVSVLESFGSAVPVRWPETLDALEGTWKLLYSSEPLPPVVAVPVPLRTVGIEQRFETEKRLVNNVIQLSFDVPGFRRSTTVDFELIVRNRFAVVASDTIKVSLDAVEARIRGLTGERMRSFLPPLQLASLPRLSEARTRRGTSPEVQTTYYGDHIFVARSPGGELRIFVRPVF
jgi:PAP_fibrillin